MSSINTKSNNKDNYTSNLNIKNINISSINKKPIINENRKQKLGSQNLVQQLLRKPDNKRYLDNNISSHQDSMRSLSLNHLSYEIPSKWNNLAFKETIYENQISRTNHNTINRSNNYLKPISEFQNYKINLIDYKKINNRNNYFNNFRENNFKDNKRRPVSVEVNNSKKDRYFLQEYNNTKDKNVLKYKINNKEDSKMNYINKKNTIKNETFSKINNIKWNFNNLDKSKILPDISKYKINININEKKRYNINNIEKNRNKVQNINNYKRYKISNKKDIKKGPNLVNQFKNNFNKSIKNANNTKKDKKDDEKIKKITKIQSI